jgi:hypothetical protein
LGLPVSSINKTDHDDITEILLKVALNTIKYNFQIRFLNCSDSVVFFVFHFILGMTIFLSLCHLTFEGKGYGV